MAKSHLVLAALMAAMAGEVRASSVAVEFSGPGVGGSLVLTYDTATDAKYPDAYEVTGISGTFSDSNNGLHIVNAPVGTLVPITRDAPEPTNLLAPHDFSRFAVASGLPSNTHGVLTYSNLFYPGGSPPTASDYTAHGGFLDIYGLMFSIGGGAVVDFWSNGAGGDGSVDYGVGVATSGGNLGWQAQAPTAARRRGSRDARTARSTSIDLGIAPSRSGLPQRHAATLRFAAQMLGEAQVGPLRVARRACRVMGGDQAAAAVGR